MAWQLSVLLETETGLIQVSEQLSIMRFRFWTDLAMRRSTQSLHCSFESSSGHLASVADPQEALSVFQHALELLRTPHNQDRRRQAPQDPYLRFLGHL